MLDEWTSLATLQGPNALFKYAGSETQVISWDGTRPTVGVVKPTLVEHDVDVLDVTLDDKTVIKASPDQIFLLQKSRKAAKDLQVGDSLLAFYTRRTDGYLHYLDPGSWHCDALAESDRRRWRPISRLVAEHMLGRRLQPGESVCFVDKDKTNADPSNLKVVFHDLSHQVRKTGLGAALAAAEKLLAGFKRSRNHAVASVEQGHCFASTSQVYVAEGAMVRPMAIDLYAAEGIWRPLIGYDEKSQSLRNVAVANAWLTKKAAPVLKIGFSNHATLRVTPEHQILTVDRGYVDAYTLKVGDRVISTFPGFSLKSLAVLTSHSPGTVWVTVAPKPDMTQPYRVFDVTTETGNLVVDGIVCHNSTRCLSLSPVASDTFVAGGVFLATS